MTAEDPLERLRSFDTSPSWRTPGEVRAVVRRRRFLRRGGAVLVAALVAGGLAVALAPSVGRAHPHRLPISARERSGPAIHLVANDAPLAGDTAAARTIATAEQQFALDLLRRSSDDGKNLALSPTSLAIALAMLQNGARGDTRDEIAHVLHTDQLPSTEQSAGWAALLRSMADPNVTLETANSLWLQRGLPMRAAFMKDLAQYFRAGVWQVDFQDAPAAASKAINAWAGRETHGRIKQLFDGELPTDTAAVLANAVYFKASWLVAFNPAETAPGKFHVADGDPVTVPFMSATHAARVLSTSDFTAAEIAYTGKRYAAQLIMPKHGSLGDLASSLTPADLAQVSEQPPGATVDLPKLTLRTYTQLNDVLAALGMHTAFTPAADFSGMSRVGLQLDKVVQRDFLKVDEHGTEAAAVTGNSMQVLKAKPLEPRFDHPFLFLVRDRTTGTILFSARVENPAT